MPFYKLTPSYVALVASQITKRLSIFCTKTTRNFIFSFNAFSCWKLPNAITAEPGNSFKDWICSVEYIIVTMLKQSYAHLLWTHTKNNGCSTESFQNFVCQVSTSAAWLQLGPRMEESWNKAGCAKQSLQRSNKHCFLCEVDVQSYWLALCCFGGKVHIEMGGEHDCICLREVFGSNVLNSWHSGAYGTQYKCQSCQVRKKWVSVRECRQRLC